MLDVVKMERCSVAADEIEPSPDRRREEALDRAFDLARSAHR
jgi:hypothetical protein